VVGLCTAFVAGFAIVLSYEASNVGSSTGIDTPTTQVSCSPSSTSCESMSIASGSLRTVNYTDELGPVSYANLAFELEASGGSAISSVRLYVGNVSAGTLQGPFEPGVAKLINMTLPATVVVSPGMTYLVRVEGFYGQGADAVWASADIMAE
jgi:hypothetical protein